jgi:3-oxoacyl-[acyl-carrier protein] reductase
MENRFRGIPRRADADRVVAEIIGAGGRGIAVQADVARPADVTRLFAEG